MSGAGKRSVVTTPKADGSVEMTEAYTHRELGEIHRAAHAKRSSGAAGSREPGPKPGPKKQGKVRRRDPVEERLMKGRPSDGQTPPPIAKHETRDLKDRELHRRIGPAVPVDDDWY